jgi:hypothetical protein
MTNESTALATVTQEELDAFYNQNKKKVSGIPRLKINSRAEDSLGNVIVGKDGKPLGAGTFCIDGAEVYQKEIKFVPLMAYNQYTKLNSEFKLESASIYFDSWDAEPLDSTGGVRCGRPASKLLKNMDEATQKEWKKNVPLTLHMFGLAFFDGGPEEGIPVNFRVSGGKYAAASKAIQSVDRMNTHYFKLSLKRDSNGGTVFFNLIMEATGERVTPTPFMISANNNFKTYITESNNKIIEQHKAAAANRLTNAAATDFMANIVSDVEYTDTGYLDDEIPF